jgi:hypothetical protein
MVMNVEHHFDTDWGLAMKLHHLAKWRKLLHERR